MRLELMTPAVTLSLTRALTLTLTLTPTLALALILTQYEYACEAPAFKDLADCLEVGIRARPSARVRVRVSRLP